MSSEPPQPAPALWHTAFPAPRCTEPGGVSREELLEMLEMLKQQQCDKFVLVDVRRNDHEGGTIRGSINLPAQSLHPALPTLYDLFKAAGVRKVIFYCGKFLGPTFPIARSRHNLTMQRSGSCAGRGPRAAGWLADFIEDKRDEEMQSLILVGGIKGWVKAGEEFTAWMDGYDAGVWRSKFDKPE